MGSSENPNWFLDCSLIDDIPHAGGDFAANDVGGLCWPPQGFNPSSSAEKNELREEKQKLKAEKESLEQQVKLLNARPSFVPQPPLVPSLFPAQGQVAGHKLMVPIVGYPSFPMWQFMPPADVDTSQDADKCPPVA
ncbi:hypothetical protein BHE74_00029645 [Ensete ventricosum]|nr:hypothetical protein BHE74_00029645 [Ensete ventricosum]